MSLNDSKFNKTDVVLITVLVMVTIFAGAVVLIIFSADVNINIAGDIDPNIFIVVFLGIVNSVIVFLGIRKKD